VFPSPLWPVLKKELIDARFIEQGLRALDSAVINVLFRSVEELGHPRRLELLARYASHFSCLADMASFDALVATVLLVQLSTLVGSADLRQ